MPLPRACLALSLRLCAVGKFYTSAIRASKLGWLIFSDWRGWPSRAFLGFWRLRADPVCSSAFATVLRTAVHLTIKSENFTSRSEDLLPGWKRHQDRAPFRWQANLATACRFGKYTYLLPCIPPSLSPRDKSHGIRMPHRLRHLRRTDNRHAVPSATAGTDAQAAYAIFAVFGAQYPMEQMLAMQAVAAPFAATAWFAQAMRPAPEWRVADCTVKVLNGDSVRGLYHVWTAPGIQVGVARNMRWVECVHVSGL